MSDKPPIRVVVVDDSPVFRDLVVEQVAATPGHELVGTAERGEDALQVVGRPGPTSS